MDTKQTLTGVSEEKEFLGRMKGISGDYHLSLFWTGFGPEFDGGVGEFFPPRAFWRCKVLRRLMYLSCTVSYILTYRLFGYMKRYQIASNIFTPSLG